MGPLKPGGEDRGPDTQEEGSRLPFQRATTRPTSDGPIACPILLSDTPWAWREQTKQNAELSCYGIRNVAEKTCASATRCHQGSQASGVLACGPRPLCEGLRQALATRKSALSPSGPRGLFLGLAGSSAQGKYLRGCPPHCKGQTVLSFREVG